MRLLGAAAGPQALLGPRPICSFASAQLGKASTRAAPVHVWGPANEFSPQVSPAAMLEALSFFGVRASGGGTCCERERGNSSRHRITSHLLLHEKKH